MIAKRTENDTNKQMSADGHDNWWGETKWMNGLTLNEHWMNEWTLNELIYEHWINQWINVYAHFESKGGSCSKASPLPFL
jgi:hypothetical protein